MQVFVRFFKTNCGHKSLLEIKGPTRSIFFLYILSPTRSMSYIDLYGYYHMCMARPWSPLYFTAVIAIVWYGRDRHRLVRLWLPFYGTALISIDRAWSPLAIIWSPCMVLRPKSPFYCTTILSYDIRFLMLKLWSLFTIKIWHDV